MTLTKKEKIILALKAALEEVTAVNGFTTNVGANVFRAKRAPFEESEMPGVALTQGEMVTMDDATGYDLHRHTVNLSARMPLDYTRDYDADANAMYGDILAKIKEDYTLGGLAIDTTVNSVTVGESVEKIAAAAVNIELTIKFRTNHLDPYN